MDNEAPASHNPDASTDEITSIVKSILNNLVSALNARDFSEQTWQKYLAPAFTLEAEDLAIWGRYKQWSREELLKGIKEACAEFPDWRYQILNMDTSVEGSRTRATVTSNTQSTLGGGFMKRSVVTWNFVLLDNGWFIQKMSGIPGLDMGAMV